MWLNMLAIYSPKNWYQNLLYYLSAITTLILTMDSGFWGLWVFFACIPRYLYDDVSLISAVVEQACYVEIQGLDLRILVLQFTFLVCQIWMMIPSLEISCNALMRWDLWKHQIYMYSKWINESMTFSLPP